MCDDTQNLNDTKSGNFSDTKISYTEFNTFYTKIVRYWITAAKAGSEIIVLYNVKSILTDNSI